MPTLSLPAEQAGLSFGALLDGAPPPLPPPPPLAPTPLVPPPLPPTPPTEESGPGGFEPGPAEGDAVSRVSVVDEPMMEVRSPSNTVMTTPMIRVISSTDDPVRMGVPTSHRRLPDAAGDVGSIASVVEEAAAQVRSLPEASSEGEVSEALRDVSDALARLADVLNEG
ncbi:hypothetical protein [Gordonia shandongensis]|uniref:hypothetical protein n=1 Tax=Gordonia shandongensis TaxID=376351 RepID=UPI00047CC49D|nr:hypothetical protein [Gordonia shandongensis]